MTWPTYYRPTTPAVRAGRPLAWRPIIRHDQRTRDPVMTGARDLSAWRWTCGATGRISGAVTPQPGATCDAWTDAVHGPDGPRNPTLDIGRARASTRSRIGQCRRGVLRPVWAPWPCRTCWPHWWRSPRATRSRLSRTFPRPILRPVAPSHPPAARQAPSGGRRRVRAEVSVRAGVAGLPSDGRVRRRVRPPRRGESGSGAAPCALVRAT